MSEITKNTFEGGINQAIDISLLKQNVIVYAENFRVLNSENTNYILTNIKGSEIVGTLPSNHWVKGVGVSNGIAYIVSAKIVNGESVNGIGEIGTFPSPDYLTGNLVWEYKPLMNYGGDNDEYPLANGPLNSKYFNFTDNKRAEVQIQQEYDGTVNVIITDNYNSIRIINSKFSKLPSFKYQIVERTGKKDTNSYFKDSWGSTMKLVLTPQTISQVEFVGLEKGGNNQPGNYTIFFKYANNEGNSTDIFAQTFPISIYNGDTFSVDGMSISGGLSGTVDKTLVLKLTNLDTSFSLLQVYIVKELSTGTTYSKLSTSVSITSSDLTIKITGYEEVEELPVESIDLDTTSLDVCRTMTQIQNRILFANIKSKSLNVDNIKLRKYSAYIIPKYKEVKIECGHNEQTQTVSEFSLSIDANNKSSFGDGRSYNLGYANPKNIYLRRGYWGGETYSLGIRYIFPDYSKSEVFPTFGYDDNDSTGSHTLVDNKVLIDDLIENSLTGYDTLTTKNINGTYRFPTRISSGSNSLVSSDKAINTFAVEFELPDFDTDLGDGTTIKDLVIGVEFVRSERIKDCLFQGVSLSCYPMHPDSPETPPEDDSGTNSYIWNDADRSPMSFAVPLIKGMVSSSRFWKAAPSDDANGPYGKDYDFGDDLPNDKVLIHLHRGLESNKLQTVTTGNKEIAGFPINNYSGLFSPDLFNNANELFPYLNNSSSSLYFQRLGRQVGAAVSKGPYGENLPVSLSLLIPVVRPISPLIKGWYTTKSGSSGLVSIQASNFIPAGNNIGNFLGYKEKERFLCTPSGLIDTELWYLEILNMTTEGYLGVRASASLLEDLYGYTGFIMDDSFPGTQERRTSLSVLNSDKVTVETDVDVITAGVQEYFNFFNVYTGSTLKTWEGIKATYRPEFLKYTPISQKMYLHSGITDKAVYDNSLEGSFNNAYYDDNFSLRNSLSLSTSIPTKTPLFWGGDCYITPFVVKPLNDKTSLPVDNAFLDGMYMSVFIESSYNCYLQPSYEGFPFKLSMLQKGGQGSQGAQNTGYSTTISKKQYNSTDFSAPAVKDVFDTRIYFSDLHVQNDFKNGYRTVQLNNYKDYSKHLGQIIKLVNIKNTLFMVQESGISVIPFNERAATAKDTGGDVYIGQGEILSQYIGSYSEKFGTYFQFACVPTNDNLYVLDLNNFKIIRLSGDKGVEFISDFKVESYIKKYLDTFISKEQDITQLDIVGHDFTTLHKEVVWTFYDKSNPTKEKNISLAYNILLGTFTSFYSYIPYQSFCLDGVQYAFDFKNQQNIIHSLETSQTRNSVFGEDLLSTVRFVVNSHYEFEKVFDNISIISNNVLPKSVVYYVDGGNTTQEIVNDPVNIHLSNAKHREGITYIAIPRVKNITNKDVTEFLDSVYTNATSQLNTVLDTDQGARFKGKSLIIELQFDTDKQLKLSSVLTQYRISNS